MESVTVPVEGWFLQREQPVQSCLRACNAQRTVEASLGWSRVWRGRKQEWESGRPRGQPQRAWRSTEGTEEPWQGFEPSRDKVYSC